MHVYCPCVAIEPETRAALVASCYPWKARDVSGSGTAYTELLAGLWHHGEAFALVEHDIVPWRGALDELDDCPEPWCAFEYPYQGRMHAGLGCCRFSAAILAAVPDAVEQTLAESTEAHPAGHWCQLDDRLTRVLTRHGYAKHVHTPAVGHLYPWPSHGCT